MPCFRFISYRLGILIWLITCAVTFAPLSDESLTYLPNAGNDFNILNGTILHPILRPRVPGSPGSLAVLQHFVDFFRTALPQWKIEFQNSTWKTPVSNDKLTPFVNLIATRDPPWSTPGEVGRLALVAHYDSKLTPNGFIGATDSAAPCAMLMHVARSLDGALTRKWSAVKAEGGQGVDVEAEKGLQIILLDGEEAYLSWTDDDSLYGARSLAEEWEQTLHPALSTYHNPISSISLFLLLDLLGEKNPRVPSYFKTTHWAYQAMAELEKRLRSLKQIRSSPNHASKRAVSSRDAKARQGQPRQEPMFLGEAMKTEFGIPFIGDDHIPFMARGVEVLHIIPTPFPRVWHHIEDDGEHLDLDTVEDWAKIVMAFAAGWMELESFLEKKNSHNIEVNFAEENKEKMVINRTEL